MKDNETAIEKILSAAREAPPVIPRRTLPIK